MNLPSVPRLLRSADNIDDFFVELPPVASTLLAFKRNNNLCMATNHLPGSVALFNSIGLR